MIPLCFYMFLEQGHHLSFSIHISDLFFGAVASTIFLTFYFYGLDLDITALLQYTFINFHKTGISNLNELHTIKIDHYMLSNMKQDKIQQKHKVVVPTSAR